MSMTAIPAGAKDHPIVLQTLSTARGSGGSVTETWTDAHEVMASRKDSHGDEDYESSQKVATGEVTWRIWYRDGLTAKGYRVKDSYSGDIYDIHSIRQIGRRQELELMTQKKDNE